MRKRLKGFSVYSQNTNDGVIKNFQIALTRVSDLDLASTAAFGQRDEELMSAAATRGGGGARPLMFGGDFSAGATSVHKTLPSDTKRGQFHVGLYAAAQELYQEDASPPPGEGT